MTEPLVADTRALLHEAALALAGTPAGERIAAACARFDEPVRVALAGRVKAGKSTVLNALLGEPLAPTDASECTTLVTWYHHGATPRVLAHLAGEHTPIEVPFRRATGPVDVDLGGVPIERVDHLEVQWPLEALRDVVLIDTPGVDSLTATAAGRTLAALAPADERAGVADVIVYLLRHVHGADIRFLEAFRHDDLGVASPLHGVAVLGRADEVGVARPDAMVQAARVASRYERDPRLRRRCHTVVPVAGLLAEGATTLTHAEFTALSSLADAVGTGAAPDLVLDADSLTAETEPPPGGAGASVRRELVRRLGLFGVRRSIAAIASGEAPTSVALARLLRADSGIDRLSATLTAQLTGRRDLLKVRAAFGVLADVLAGAAAPNELVDRFEMLTANAHALREARLLEGLRDSEVDLEAADVDRAERLLGAGTAAARLGLADDADAAVLRDVVEREIAHWQRVAGSPFIGPHGAEAARVVLRTVEGVAEAVRAPSGTA